jgi:hypothetical protein
MIGETEPLIIDFTESSDSDDCNSNNNGGDDKDSGENEDFSDIQTQQMKF